jgi:hypothetical protein
MMSKCETIGNEIFLRYYVLFIVEIILGGITLDATGKTFCMNRWTNQFLSLQYVVSLLLKEVKSDNYVYRKTNKCFFHHNVCKNAKFVHFVITKERKMRVFRAEIDFCSLLGRDVLQWHSTRTLVSLREFRSLFLKLSAPIICVFNHYIQASSTKK